jgi:serine/threonine protein kinase
VKTAELAPLGPVEAPPATQARVWPEKIGRYFVVRWLGGGGFADVYLAKDPETSKRVAVKVPRRDKFRTEQSAGRFLKEARTAADLEHPAIVQVSDYGRGEEGTCYVVMEYLEGRSLQDVLKTEKLSPRQAAEIVLQVAEGLRYAHQRGIYHRDIKPANILIDKEGQAKIVDFGLAVNEEDRWSYKDELSGTWPYMSPEQVRGEAHRIDGRTDLWSLGVVLYQLLARQRPFNGRTADQLRDEILHRPPKPVRMVDESVPKVLDEICRRCLAKSADDRLPTADELAAGLRAYLQPARVGGRGRGKSLRIVGVLAAAVLVIACAWTLTVGHWEPSSPWRRLFPDYQEIIWPGFRGRPDVRDGTELLVSSDDICLVGLESLADGRYKFSLRIRQTDWTGEVGVFLGYHKEIRDGRESAVFQLIRLRKLRRSEDQKPVWEWPDVYVIQRELVVIPPNQATVVQLRDLGSQEVAPETLQHNPKLEVQVEDGAVVCVRWADRELDRLRDSAGKNGPIAEAAGPWGLFQFFGSSWFSQPEFSGR